MTESSRGVPTIIALHGHGDEPESARVWAAAVAAEGWRVETPAAPRDDSGDRSWFDTGPRGVVTATFERSRDELASVAAHAAVRGPVAVAGFSQGAALALGVGDLPGVAAVVAFCGFLPELDDLDPAAGPPALVLPSAGDEVVPAFLGEDAAAAMVAAGRTVTVETLPGEHVVSAVAARRASAWLREQRWA